jgi:hypothetical protein
MHVLSAGEGELPIQCSAAYELMVLFHASLSEHDCRGEDWLATVVQEKSRGDIWRLPRSQDSLDELVLMA